ncbi:SDR family NAD(P)-dependent oxidoreductase [Novosphingobium sp. FGD1]|uniref:SDR family NAD(P)-dependent oxidoreductase n=1 Tax=Novosphingobium silvae TaxID=2692619 RepID=A0A7X4GDG8_9SPHN|nr:type I polyketide synthase [Novosphingobium silvae]MYL96615.1 SDR family NAD(P)-dependent oxidoreductase [Novosphingobium silvae]
MHEPIGSFDGDNFPGTENAIAIVGMSCRFAGVRSPDTFWQLLREGREAVETFPEDELLSAGVPPALLRNPAYVRRGAPLADMECFDPALFGLSKRDASIMDPQHRHFLECAWEALEDAGHTPAGFEGPIGVFAGSGHNAYMPYNLLTNGKLVDEVGLFLLRHTSNDKDFLTTRVSYLLDLKGPSINVQTACSTSLVSIHMAAQSLLSGECDMALAGGASIELPHRQGYLYEEGEILSPDGHCRPFDAQSKGTVFGSGVAVVALRRLEDAIASGDHIHAVIRGSAINNDGSGKVGYLAPSVDGQAAVIAEALAVSGVDPSGIDYVEAHGTGTPIGDPIEVAALRQAFAQGGPRDAPCGLGSVKANIGHTDTAAGAAGIIKVALALRHEELPPVPHFTAPNPECALDAGPFRVQAASARWPRRDERPRRAGVSSLGVGGTNAHVVMEEAPVRAPGGPSRRRQLLVTSGASETAADANAAALADHFATHAGTGLADAAFTLAQGRRHLAWRRFAVAQNAEGAASALAAASRHASARQPAVPGRPVAFQFCGGGLQHVDMAHGLYESEPAFRADIDRGLAVLARIGVPELKRWLFPAESERVEAAAQLERPSNALPALFLVQTALARLWMSLGIVPTAMIGHSCGEYAAAHIAGVIDLETGLRIVHARGRLFETTASGGMISVPLSEAELAPLLPPQLSIATINAPGLCVVSGAAQAIESFLAQLRAKEIEAQAIPIEVAAHSAMLDPILPEFRALLRSLTFSPPQIPFASNLTGKWVEASEATDPEYWVRHLREPVRYTDGLQCLLAQGEQVLLEVGPGRSMTSLARQHPARRPSQPLVASMRHPQEDVADDQRLLEALGELWALGVDPDWQAFWGEERRLRLPLPTYRFDRQRHWVEPGATLHHAGTKADSDARLALEDWAHEPVWSRENLPPAPPPTGPALVLCGSDGFGETLARRLRDRGVPTVTVSVAARYGESGEHFCLQPTRREDWARLFARLATTARMPGQVYHAWLANGSGTRRRPALAEQTVLDLGLHALIALSPELAALTDENAIVLGLVTDNAQRVAGETGLLPLKATALGAARTVGAEYPGIEVRAIDIDPSAAASPTLTARQADAVIDEISLGREARGAVGGDVALRAGERWRLGYQGVRGPLSPAEETWLEERGTYLVTGGLGGLGLAIADHLAHRWKARLILVGRSALPPRDQWAQMLSRGELALGIEEKVRRLLALEAAGAEIELLQADVADERALARGIRRACERLGRIDGVFHAAGTLDDGLIETRTRAAVETVLRPKVAGTLALEAALAGHSPRFMLLFSSISAFAGIAGQVDYAAANAFLDAYAQARRGDPLTRVQSVGWSQWAEVGMAASLGSRDGCASALPEDLGTGKTVAHPFLERVCTISDDEFVVTGILTPERHWVLDEHRVVDAGALLPGTSLLEMSRAAVALVCEGPLELSDFTFLKPFAVPDGTARELRIHVRRRAGAGWRVRLLGRPVQPGPAGWTEHAHGLVRAHALPPLRASLDLGAIAERCAPARCGAQDQPMMAFGPRWNTVSQALANAQGPEALLQLDLPEAFHGEVADFGLHPALLDFATAGAQTLIPGRDPSRAFYAPFTYRRFLAYAPLPARIWSHVRLVSGDETGHTAVFNVTITDADGLVLAEVREFTMMRMADAALLSARAAPLAEAPAATAATSGDGWAPAAEGILPEEGVEVVARLLSGRSGSHTVISPYELDGVLSRLRAPPRAVRRDGAGGGAAGEAADLPATPVEQVIADLWCELLGMEAVGRHDNFFDLGGHSLLAVQFTNRLRRKTGKTLPLATMLGQPTVANLAAVIDPEGRAPDIAAAGGEQLPSGVVTIRKGSQVTPLFFVHDGLGETLLYRGLALRLDPARPILGLEPLRKADGNYAHTRIDEMASHYIQQMRAVQAHGPYLLAGLCAGGVIAFEMAQQLQGAGQQVAFVGIIDAADVEARKHRFGESRARLARVAAMLGSSDLAQVVPDLARKAWNLARWEVESRLREARDRRTVRALRAGEQPGDAAPQANGEEPAIPFLKLYEVAHKEHRPMGILHSASVALFKAADDTGITDDTPYRMVYRDFALGWGKRVREDIVILDVPGGHSSNLQEPHVDTLAPLFQAALDEAIAEHGAWHGAAGGNDDDALAVLVEAAE